MTSTSPIVTFGLFATGIKQDSSPACADLQSFAKIADLKTGNVSARPLITYEPDYWLLSGNYKFISPVTASVHVGLMSDSMSDENGDFAVPVVLTITFGSVHESDSLTLRFMQASDDYCNDLDIAYYNASDVLIRQDNYTPAEWQFSTGVAVSDFKKIIITFNSTNKPYRYLRVTGIDYGTLIELSGADIKAASVVEEVSPIAVELPMNVFEVSLFSAEASFSITNPAGDYAGLKTKQPMTVYEDVDGFTSLIGQFYVDDWENPSENEIRFTCIDAVGILDKTPFLGGIWLTPITASDLLLEIMGDIDMPYELDPNLAAVEIMGWLPISSYREALQQIAFAIGGYVNTARTLILQINETELAEDQTSQEYTITSAEKGISSPLSLRPLVTAVEVVSHNFIENIEETELFNDTLSAGTYTIKFAEPQHDLGITGASIDESGANYAIITVAAPGVVTLTGQGYTDTQQIYRVENTGLDPDVRKNVVKITEATLVHTGNAQEITQRVYDYYQGRYLQKTKLFAPSLEVGRSVLVDTLNGSQIQGVTEKMSIDLALGFVSDTEIAGVIAA